MWISRRVRPGGARWTRRPQSGLMTAPSPFRCRMPMPSPILIDPALFDPAAVSEETRRLNDEIVRAARCRADRPDHSADPRAPHPGDRRVPARAEIAARRDDRDRRARRKDRAARHRPEIAAARHLLPYPRRRLVDRRAGPERPAVRGNRGRRRPRQRVGEVPARARTPLSGRARTTARPPRSGSCAKGRGASVSPSSRSAASPRAGISRPSCCCGCATGTSSRRSRRRSSTTAPTISA